jgi:hypothetical protein
MGGWPFSSSAYYGQAADMVFEVSLVVSAGESQNSGLMTEHGICGLCFRNGALVPSLRQNPAFVDEGREVA